MCGIAGIVSKRQVAERLYGGILKLEYRGYDSCGMAVLNGSGIEARKNVGKIKEVNDKEDFPTIGGTTGIAHTRWATHGGVTKANSHPHLSSDGRFALVHNGIISNFRELRKKLEATGITFSSETDTEVIVQLLAHHASSTDDIETALRATMRELTGTYAIAFITTTAPDTIYAARRESPLLLGVGSNEMYLGSDINAFIEHTRQMAPMLDDEYVVLTPTGYTIKDAHTGEPKKRQVETITWSAAQSEKGGFPHFMLKEIHEQPQALQQVLSIGEEDLMPVAKAIREAKHAYMVGIGTTYYVALTGQYYLRKYANVATPAVYADEFPSLAPVDKDDFVLAVSQSGETYDTLSALRYAKKHGATTAAIINAVGSTMSREVNHAILQGSGPEICVLSTKAALAQMVLLIRIALLSGRESGYLSAADYDAAMEEITRLPEHLRQLINRRAGTIYQLAKSNSETHNWLYMGRGVYHAIALEAALKMKEVTYLHAEGMPAGFLKHGNIAMIDDSMTTLAFIAPPSEGRNNGHDLHEAIMGNVEEVRARQGKVIGIHFGPDTEDGLSQELILDNPGPVTAPLCQLVAGQLLSYHMARILDRDPDQPRSLAKSVTVP